MADALADLFSAESPPASPQRAQRARTPRSTTPEQHSHPLFFSPGDTPDRPRRSNSRIPSVGPAHHTPPPPHFDPDGISAETYGDKGLMNAAWTVTADGGVEYDPLAVDAFAAEAGAGARAEDGDEPQGKKRRVMAKVDVDRLMGERGFPALMKAAKKFRPRGKGQEAKDLKDLLNIYQMWAHGMFPKGDFAHTVSRVETICRTRRMELAMKGYREAFYPRPESPEPRPLSPEYDNLPADNDERGPSHSPERASDPLDKERPLFDMPEEDGPDMDELIAMEEMERGAASSAPPPPPTDEDDVFEGLYD